MVVCKNCGQEFDLNFCPNCGQKASVRRIDFSTITTDLPAALLDIDKGFLFNLIELFKRPGYAIKDYLEGKRKSFYHPLSYMLIIAGTMLLAMTFLNIHYYDPVADAGMSPAQIAYWKTYDATQQAWIHYYKYYIPFFLPWMSLLFYVWLRVLRQPYNYWECVVISMFVAAQMTVPQIPILVFSYLTSNTALIRFLDTLNVPILFVLYFFQFYQLGNPELKRGWRIILSVVGSLLLIAFDYIAIFSFLRFATQLGI